MTATTPPSPKGARRRAEILRVARADLIDHGLDRFSMRAVAEALEMTLGNLQYYFPTRDDLLAAVLETEAAEDAAAIRGVVADDPEQRLHRVVTTLADRWSTGQRGVYMPLGVLALHGRRFAELARAASVRVHDELAPIVQELDPSADREEARTRAVLIAALLDGSVLQPYDRTGTRSGRSMVPRVAAAAVTLARDGAPPRPSP